MAHRARVLGLPLAVAAALLAFLAASPVSSAHTTPTANDAALVAQAGTPNAFYDLLAGCGNDRSAAITVTPGVKYLFVVGAGTGAGRQVVIAQANTTNSEVILNSAGVISEWDTGSAHLLQMTNVTIDGQSGFWAVIEWTPPASRPSPVHVQSSGATNRVLVGWNPTGGTGVQAKLTGRASCTAPIGYVYDSTVTAATPPPTPATFTSVAGDRAVSLQWADSAGATGYNVFRATTSLGSTLPLNTTGYTYVTSTTSSEYVDTGRTPGTTYYYRVTAFDSDAESAATGERSETPYESPQNFAVASSTAGPVLTWTAPTDPRTTGYKVHRNGTLLATLNSAANTSFTDAETILGVTYTYTVSAVGSYGEIASAEQSGAKRDVPLLLATQDPTGGLNLTWSSGSTGITSWKLNRSTSSNMASPTTLTTQANASWADDTCTERVAYYYTVVPLFGAAYGNTSSTTAAVCPDVTPPEEIEVTVESYQDHVAISWTPSEDEDVVGYRIYRDDVLQAIVGPDASIWYDYNVTDTNFHTYSVRAEDSSGNEGARESATTALLPATSSGGGGSTSSSGAGGTAGAASASGESAESDGAAAGSPFSEASAIGQTLVEKGRDAVGSLVDSVPRLSPLDWLLLVIGLVLVIASFPQTSAALGVQIPGSGPETLAAAVIVFGLLWWGL